MEHLTRRAALLVLLLVLALVSVAAPAAADSSGIRWKHSHICVENWTTGTMYQAARDVTYHANRYTNLAIWHYRPGGCGTNHPTMHKIVIRPEYSTSKWAGLSALVYKSCILPTSKPFQCFVSATVKLNSRYGYSYSQWRHVAAHELGHALGLAHVTFTCDTAMRPYFDRCIPDRLTWWDRVGTTTPPHPGLNLIYLW